MGGKRKIAMMNAQSDEAAAAFEELRKDKQRRMRSLALRLREEHQSEYQVKKELAKLRRKLSRRRPRTNDARSKHDAQYAPIAGESFSLKKSGGRQAHDVVIVPLFTSFDLEAKQRMFEASHDLKVFLRKQIKKLDVFVDQRPVIRPGSKFKEWEEKAVPFRCEIGRNEIRDDTYVLSVMTTVGDVAVRYKNLTKAEFVIRLRKEIEKKSPKEFESVDDDVVKDATIKKDVVKDENDEKDEENSSSSSDSSSSDSSGVDD